jgi:hypothetical protein
MECRLLHPFYGHGLQRAGPGGVGVTERFSAEPVNLLACILMYLRCI